MAARVALEGFGAEAAGGAAARGAFHALGRRIRSRGLGAASAAAAGMVRIATAVLIAAVLVLAIFAQKGHLTKTRYSRPMMRIRPATKKINRSATRAIFTMNQMTAMTTRIPRSS